ncbi:hypothetical protein VTH82DRAFT_3407 [Thermothelomyces myriococcoides]
MSQPPPKPLDFRSKSQASVSRPLRSPRLHLAGEVPPELSPLDAFALQSRLLAKQLEDSAKQGRRMSRLPPLTDDSPLIVQGRSDYFRSLSHDSGSEEEHPPLQNVGLGLKTDIDDDIANRPRSMHPRLSEVPPTDSSVPVPPLPNTNADPFKANQSSAPPASDEGFFWCGSTQGAITVSYGRRQPVTDTGGGTIGSPRWPMFTKRSSSLNSSPLDFTDEEGISTMSTSLHSMDSRKFSSSSSAFSPAQPPFQRSPSVASDASGLHRPQFNFSRPLSRAGTPSIEPPVRQASSDSHASSLAADDAICTPRSYTSEASREPTADEGTGAAPSYIYSKFTLPRGKPVQRSSMILLNDPPARSSMEQAISQISTAANLGISQPPPSPPNLSPGSSETQQPDGSRPSQESVPGSDEEHQGQGQDSHVNDAAAEKSLASASTSDSASTIKASKSVHSVTPTMSDLTAEEHLNKAIALHESGSLQQSTWHLRHAAKQGHPTGMLLYALACRHGWGMRPNPREGVEWLRKAADSASLEIAGEEDQVREGKKVDIAERKTHKAQFALSIYELGVSHMNGWGVEQDKALGLRCFEIAASWGDVDALAEAGFCYAQGIGCKKDLKKSAKYYREAEARGMNMVGNSWIHKPKYNDDKDKAPRSKSKARKSLFSRKKD